MSDSPHLGLGYLAPAQAQKHVTVNEALRRLDALVQLGVLNRTLTAPPSSSAEGDRHIVAAGATGAWAGKSGLIAARLDGAWVFVTPKPGWLAYVAAENLLVVFLAGAWTGALGALSSLDGLTRLGVNATSDTTNRLAVASQAVLFNHDGAGVQVKLNKQGAADTASLLFQTGFSGRAEFGLTGADGLALKVSPDGANWVNALAVNAASGAVDMPATPFVQVDKFTSSGTWTKPAWASRVRVMVMSGGAGGGSGALRGPGVAVSGGGGGPGVAAEAEFQAASLPSTVSVTIGAGGSGGAAQTVADGAGAAGSGGGQTSFGTFLRALPNAAAGSGGGTAAAPGGSALGARFLPPCGDVSGGAGNFAAGGAGGNGPGRYGSGAGGGGGLTAANAEAAGGASGAASLGTGFYASQAGGTTPGGAGAAGAVSTLIASLLAAGNSGSGGASGLAAPGGAGGDGGAPGGGGGGGGASRNGQSSGKGGNGARGEAWIVSMR